MQQMAVPPPLRRGSATRSGRITAALACGTVLLVALAGCSGSPAPKATAKPTPSVRMGGQKVVDADDGVRLALPVGWYQIPLGSAPDQVLSRLVHDETQLGAIDEQIRIGQLRGMRVFALQPEGSRRPNSLNLAVTSASSSTLDSLQAQIKVASAEFAADKPQFDRVNVPAGQALRVHYRLRDGDSTTQYYLLAFTQAYVLTVTSTSGGTGTPTDTAVANAVARTLRLSPVA
jgi:hypothetical protein